MSSEYSPSEDVFHPARRNNAVRHIEPPQPPLVSSPRAPPTDLQLLFPPQPPPPPSGQSWERQGIDIRNEGFMERVTLYQAGLNGDWDTVKRIWLASPTCLSTRITKGGETVLHIAAAAKQTFLAKTLILHMDSSSLVQANKLGNTALCFAAVSGVVEIAETMVLKNNDLPNIRGSEGMTPLHMVVLLGHLPMVKYLLTVTDDALLDEKDRICLLTSAIDTNLFEVASTILNNHPHLAIRRDAKKETALHALARKPLKSCGNPITLWPNYKLQWRRVTDDEESREPQMALDLAQRLWNEVIKCNDAHISYLIGYPWRLLFVAAKLGKVEFLTVLIRSYPDIIWKVNESRYSIFHIAVIHRHEGIFKLIYEIGAIKDLITTYKDDHGNNMLHLASKLAPPTRLNTVSGAALQMQREILWFEAVESIMRPEYTEAENNDQKTPHALFSEEHEGLRVKGEEWMKKTAESCTLVAALIATVVFSAAFQLPGGVNSQGSPNLVARASFLVFAISNAASLFTSTASILMFLSILTSRYAERDFLQSLPSKLMMGLILLLISMATMIVAFTATFFITFQVHGPKWVAILVATIAFVPVTLFASQQFRLLVDIYHSTYKSRSIFQSYKPKIYQQGYSLSFNGPVYETIVTFPQQLCKSFNGHVNTSGMTSSDPSSSLPDLGPSHSGRHSRLSIPTASLIVDPNVSAPSAAEPEAETVETFPQHLYQSFTGHVNTTGMISSYPGSSLPGLRPSHFGQHSRLGIPTTSLIMNPIASAPSTLPGEDYRRHPIPTASLIVDPNASAPSAEPEAETIATFPQHLYQSLTGHVNTAGITSFYPGSSLPGLGPSHFGQHSSLGIPTASLIMNPIASAPSTLPEEDYRRHPIPTASLIMDPNASAPSAEPEAETIATFPQHLYQSLTGHVNTTGMISSYPGSSLPGLGPSHFRQHSRLGFPTASLIMNPIASAPSTLPEEDHRRHPIPTASLIVDPNASAAPLAEPEGGYRFGTFEQGYRIR